MLPLAFSRDEVIHSDDICSGVLKHLMVLQIEETLMVLPILRIRRHFVEWTKIHFLSIP